MGEGRESLVGFEKAGNKGSASRTESQICFIQFFHSPSYFLSYLFITEEKVILKPHLSTQRKRPEGETRDE